jgi:hypothetical protein
MWSYGASAIELGAGVAMNALTASACLCALIALLFFPAFAVAGMIFGLLLVVRGKVNHGFALVLMCALGGYFGMRLDLPYGDIILRNTIAMARMILNS